MAAPNPSLHPRGPAILRLAILAAILTIALTGVTFWLSYEALHVLAAGHGLQDQRAWAWPATIDAFIVIGEVLILRASLLGRVDWLAVTLTASGSVGSIVLNVASAGAVDRMTQVVHAVPPCAALLIFTALMRQIYRALSTPVVAPSASVDTPVVERTEQLLPPLPTQPPAPQLPPAEPQAEEEQPEEEQEPAAIVYQDPRCYVIRALYEGGYRPTTSEMRDALIAAGYDQVGGSTLRGTLRGDEIEKREPHLRDLPASIKRTA
jgi:hypothetical protein